MYEDACIAKELECHKAEEASKKKGAASKQASGGPKYISVNLLGMGFGMR